MPLWPSLLDRCDAIVFTGGIGENDRGLRAEVLDQLGQIGVQCDHAANADEWRLDIEYRTGPKVLVIPTDEEWQIAQDSDQVCRAAAQRSAHHESNFTRPNWRRCWPDFGGLRPLRSFERQG